jgi:hypothetical protein
MFGLVNITRVQQRGNSKVPLRDCPAMSVKNCMMCVFFYKKCVGCGKLCVICNKVEFTTNITYVTEIHTFYFYNNKHTFTTTNTHLSQNTHLPQNIHILPKPTPVP